MLLRNNPEKPLPVPPRNAIEPTMGASSRKINITVNAIKKGSLAEQIVVIQGLSNPVQFQNIASRVMEQGCIAPIALVGKRVEHAIKITEGPSIWTMSSGGEINYDQPLLHFYHKCYLVAVGAAKDAIEVSDTPKPLVSVSESVVQEDGVEVGTVKVSFHRTVRVPDNKEKHALPAGLGRFKLFPVASGIAGRLPDSVINKGGVFLSLYQREAMWMSFRPTGAPCAVKVSVGGVNALTGLPQNQLAPKGKQDYLAINPVNGQLWLDGISTSPGVVRQFVAMPLGKGYTVEGQVTGKEDVGGVQIDVFPEYPTSVSFKSGDKILNMYKTPKELNLSVGASIQMVDNHERPADIVLGQPGSHVGACLSDNIFGSNIEFESREEQMYIFCKMSSEKVIIACSPSDTIVRVKEKIQKQKGFAPNQQRLLFGGKELKDGHTIKRWFKNLPIIDTLELIDFGQRTDYKIGSKSVLDFARQFDFTDISDDDDVDDFLVRGFRTRGGARRQPQGDAISGFAAGGQISQQINRDRLPAVAYDQDNASRLHVTVINAAHFTAVTGLPSPPSPISAKTYKEHKLPWYKLYDEHIPSANNASTPTALANVVSIAELDRQRASQGNVDVQTECEYCTYEMATYQLQPCGHAMCDSCATTRAYPTCQRPVSGKNRFAAPMPIPGHEENDGMPADSLSTRIIELGKSASRGKVASFCLREHAVSALNG